MKTEYLRDINDSQFTSNDIEYGSFRLYLLFHLDLYLGMPINEIHDFGLLYNSNNNEYESFPLCLPLKYIV